MECEGRIDRLGRANQAEKGGDGEDERQPPSPMVMDFEVEGWLMRILAGRTRLPTITFSCNAN